MAMKRSNLLFLVTYIITLSIFVFGGYYFYADYTLNTQMQKSKLQQNGRFQSDLSYVDLPRISLTLTSNLDHHAHSGNIRMDITLEVENKYAARVAGNKSRITDRIIHYTQTLDYNELARPRSTVWLRPDLLQVVNGATDPTPVKDLIFREMVVF